MSFGDKLENAKDKVVGKVKEVAVDITHNEDLAAEGEAQQAEGHVGDAAEQIKDVFKG